jgi:hypothetical protein
VHGEATYVESNFMTALCNGYDVRRIFVVGCKMEPSQPKFGASNREELFPQWEAL